MDRLVHTALSAMRGAFQRPAAPDTSLVKGTPDG